MNPTLIIGIASIIIIGLGVFLALAALRITSLKRQLLEEQHKRVLPLLLLDIDPRESKIFLRNQSDCHAKDIAIENFSFPLGYDFNKTLTLKFEPVELLQAREERELHYKIYEGEHEFRSSAADNLIAHLTGAKIEAILHYTNIENTPFDSTIIKEKNRFVVKEAKPSPGDTDNPAA